MVRRRAAASADDGGARPDDLGHLHGEIGGLSLIDYPAAQYSGIAGVGHDGQGLSVQVQVPDALQQMAGTGHTVKAHRVYLRQRSGALDQLPAPQAVPGDAVEANGEGDDEKGLRAVGFQVTGKFGDALVGGQGFHKKVGQTLGQEEVRLTAVSIGGGQACTGRGGTQVREHAGAVRSGGLQRQTAGGLR